MRLVNVSCSGAEFMDGIFLAQQRRVIPSDQDALDWQRDGLAGRTSYGNHYLKKSQVNLVRDVLCATEEGTEPISKLPEKGVAVQRKCSNRKADPSALLFTGGGNDVKFAGAVTGLLVPDRTVSGRSVPEWVLRLVRDKIGAILVRQLGDGAKELEKDYGTLIAAAAEGALVRPDQVLLVRYPDPLGGADSSAKNGFRCTGPLQQARFVNSYMSFGPTAREVSKSSPIRLWRSKINWASWIGDKEVVDFGAYSFPAVQSMLSNSGVKTVAWEASNTKLFAKRVICAPVASLEVPSVPTFFYNDNKNECAMPFPRQRTLKEIQFEAPGRMMVNSSNDSMLNLRSWGGDKEPTDGELLVAAGGTVHPTHEAYALAADSAYDGLCQILRVAHDVCADNLPRK
ncbi:hypothetical protein ACSFA8_22610 [Variovorax sp. RT4R15]|uniref:hypothetical protein n=1 Tax=Variovorax sp. RT4R15 TaxID=3443737 RepID=UPI003F44C06D